MYVCMDVWMSRQWRHRRLREAVRGPELPSNDERVCITIANHFTNWVMQCNSRAQISGKLFVEEFVTST